ncbi:MAG: CinA family nicotinamide mononucleotide deamidase-related protein [Planctomycetes bacterium]|nr:CinA family nicotinamide mononucleotide deamidase-related protein [Planctomycetota bacterium]MCW8136101.1 CinA family nicotinamide mononucleotide deamidase-related protein [Planctomycetota bacterium]
MDRNAVVFSVGNEVVRGHIVDTNSAWLSRALAEIGFDVRGHAAITDDSADIARAVRDALDAGLLVICTGGIGPTVDDRTREGVAHALGVELKLDLDDLARLQERYSAMGRKFPEGSERQCMRPDGATLIPNAFGTASCFLARKGGSGVAVLPGVPREMKGIWDEELRKALIEAFGLPGRWHTRELRVFGLPESDLNNRVADLLDKDGAILVDDAVIRLRWRVLAETDEQADAVLRPTLEEARKRLGELVFAAGDVSLEQATIDALRNAGLKAACAESCTGGLIAHMLTNVPGSSDVLLESAVVYSNEAKQRRLGVKPETLAAHGAVSGQVAAEMARGALAAGGAGVAVATTGVAGPGGGSENKPVGTVWLAAAMGGDVKTWRLRVPGDRELVKSRSARAALNALRLAALHGRLPDAIAQWVSPP